MKRSRTPKMEALWQHHNALWRDTAQVASQWCGATDFDSRLLKHSVTGDWWETLSELGITLLVTREYEHLLMALSVKEGRPLVSYMPLPHPSGLAVNRKRKIVHVASTRNPNQVFDLAPVRYLMKRADVAGESLEARTLVPVRSGFLPGSLYIHDLALIDGELYANAVGQNAVVRLDAKGGFERAWWPRCIEVRGKPLFDRNLIQLNSIAAGNSLESSYFSASTDKISRRRPGHRNFPVDRRGVIFSGRTRGVIARGLTRPHSARLLNKTLWVDNSGYGELGRIEGEEFEAVVRLPGWTRGLCFKEHVAFVGTSRVIPRFQNYAPGLDVERSVCGLHAVDTRTAKVLGSITWPYGNQIFAVEWLPAKTAASLPFRAGRKRSPLRDRLLFYAYQTEAL